MYMHVINGPFTFSCARNDGVVYSVCRIFYYIQSTCNKHRLVFIHKCAMEMKLKKWTLGVIAIALTLYAMKILLGALPQILLIFFETAGYCDHMLPESKLDTLDILRHHGYPAECHSVTTPDGYILEIHRIPYGKLKDHHPGRITRHPVFVMHGFSCSSGIWVANGLENSLGFVLADAGYDVFMGNLRGNCYTKHKILTEDQDEFWQFSVDDHALLDLTTMLDFTLNITGQEKLTYVGHSMGSSTLLMLLAERKEYNDKIKHAFLQAPVIFNQYGKSLLVYLARNYNMSKLLWDQTFGGEAYFKFSITMRKLTAMACSYPKALFFCDIFFSNIAGYNYQNFNSERLHVFISHALYGTSRKVNQQFSQMFLEGKQHHLDLGQEENLKKYLSVTPPDYNFTSITASITCFRGYLDAFVDAKDWERLKQIMPSSANFEVVPMDIWNHFDFLLNRNATKYHYSRILDHMAGYDQELIK